MNKDEEIGKQGIHSYGMMWEKDGVPNGLWRGFMVGSELKDRPGPDQARPPMQGES